MRSVGKCCNELCNLREPLMNGLMFKCGRAQRNVILYKTAPILYDRNWNSNCKLEISKTSTKAKSWEPAYSQALIQKQNRYACVKIQRHRRADSQTTMVDAVRVETAKETEGKIGFAVFLVRSERAVDRLQEVRIW